MKYPHRHPESQGGGWTVGGPDVRSGEERPDRRRQPPLVLLPAPPAAEHELAEVIGRHEQPEHVDRSGSVEARPEGAALVAKDLDPHPGAREALLLLGLP